MVVRRGEIWWAALSTPVASGPGFPRPVLVIQADSFNKSSIATVVIAAITTNVRLAAAPGNVALTRRQSGLPKDSVVNVSQILTVDRSFLTERVGRVAANKLQEVDAGLLRVLDLGNAARP